MEFNEIVQFATYVMVAIGVMAFIVSIITQVIKELPGLKAVPTSAVVVVLSLVLCPIAFVALMAWAAHPIAWYMIFACMIAAFIVALVSMDGWEHIAEIWSRTKYNKH